MRRNLLSGLFIYPERPNHEGMEKLWISPEIEPFQMTGSLCGGLYRARKRFR